MRNGDGPVRDEERGTRELSAEGTVPSDGSRRMTDGIDGIPEQARPHPEAASVEDDSPEAGLVDENGLRDRNGAVRSAPRERRIASSPVHGGPPAREKPRVGEEARARGRATIPTVTPARRSARQVLRTNA